MSEESSRKHLTLSYGHRGAQQAPRTRIVIEPIDGGIRFTDPPQARAWTRKRLMAGAALTTLVAFGVALLFAHIVGVPMKWGSMAAGILALMSLLLTFRDLRRLASAPTIIEARNGRLFLLSSSGKQRILEMKDLSYIRATNPRRFLAFGGRISTLVIGAAGIGYELLSCRDYIEVRWLAHQLRKAAGMSEIDPGEPALNLKLDQQEEPGSDPAALPTPKAIPAWHARSDGFRDGAIRYLFSCWNGMGCATFLILMACWVVGLMMLVRLVGALIICIAFGKDAYFHGHLRFVPHRGFDLNNGQTLGWPFRLLFVFMWFCVQASWMILTLVVLDGIRRASARVVRGTEGRVMKRERI